MTQITIPDPQPLEGDWNPNAITFLVYGPAGQYKTPAVATWPKPIVYIDTDNGMLSLISIYDDLDGLYRVAITDKQSTISGYAGPIGWITVMEVLKSVASTGLYGTTNPIKPATLVLDTLSTASKYALNHAMFNLKHAGRHPTLQDWGEQMSELTKALDYGIACPCHFVCVAHEQYFKEETTGRVWLLPLVTGKLANNLDNAFSEVYHTKVTQVANETKYNFETRPSGLVRARSRMGVPPLIPANFSEVGKRITELKTKLAAHQQKGGSPQLQQQSPQATLPSNLTKLMKGGS